MSPATKRHFAALRLLLAAPLFVTCFGCTSIPTAGSLPFLAADDEEAAAAPAAATCTVELRTNTRRPQTVDVPLAEKTCVQDVLDASRATSKFRNLDVVILRPTPEASEPLLKLVCRFDRRTRRIGWESDYAVLPGDRVIVREAPSGGLNTILTSMLGPVIGGR